MPLLDMTFYQSIHFCWFSNNRFYVDHLFGRSRYNWLYLANSWLGYLSYFFRHQGAF